MCSVIMSGGAACGRPVRNTHCILHEPDAAKPSADFLAEVQATVSRAMGRTADLSYLHWYGLSFDSITWGSAVCLAGSHFHGATPFGVAKFSGDVDLSNCNFDQRLLGNPEFAGDLSLRDSKFDGIKLEQAVVQGACDLRGVQFWSDSFITGCKFRKAVDLRDSKIWELHFSNCEFESDLTFKGATGRISFRWLRKAPSSIDISGMSIQGHDLNLAKFTGSLLATGTQFDGVVDLSDAKLEQLNLSGAMFRKDLILLRAIVKNDLVLAGAVCDGGLDLTGLDVLSGRLDLSNMSLARPDSVRLIRVNRRPDSPPLRLSIGTSNLDGARIDDVQWNRQGGRLRLDDEQAVRDGHLSPAQAALTYRRLRKPLEEGHWYEEADDCLAVAMEMRRRDASLGWTTRFFLFIYRLSSFYGSSYSRAIFMLAMLVFLILAPAFALVGLTTGAYVSGGAPAISPVAADVPPPAEGANIVTSSLRLYGRGLVHTLETGTLRDSTSFRPLSAIGVALESAARVLVPAQFAALLLALRRRFVRA